MSGTTIRIYDTDKARLAAAQAKRTLRDGITPSFADLIHEYLDRMEAGGDL